MKNLIKIGKWGGLAFIAYQAVSFSIALAGVTYVAVNDPDAILKFWGLS